MAHRHGTSAWFRLADLNRKTVVYLPRRRGLPTRLFRLSNMELRALECSSVFNWRLFKLNNQTN